MRGLILGINEGNGHCVAATDDGERFPFTRQEWQSSQAPMNGMRIDFAAKDGRAVDVYPVPDTGFNGSGVAVKTPQAQQAFKLGAIALGCAAGGLLLPFVGLILSSFGLAMGIKGARLGRQSGEQAGTIMGVVGAVVSGLTILVYVASLIFWTSIGAGLGFFALR